MGNVMECYNVPVFQRGSRGFLIARDLDVNMARALKMSTSKTNMAARNDCYLKTL